ncbi:GGDEF domain-containing protein [Pseudomonas aeruginosa]|nr:GGDEF domain-containing protein [Pseudomonas aeruginosa]
MALILVDVDDFKAYNDHYGHPAGDAALRQLGVVLRQGARRPLDIAARLGGRSSPCCSTTARRATPWPSPSACGRRWRRWASSTWAPAPALPDHQPGVAYSTSGMGLDALYREADRALYEAKDAGRNAVRVAFRQHDRLE